MCYHGIAGSEGPGRQKGSMVSRSRKTTIKLEGDFGSYEISPDDLDVALVRYADYNVPALRRIVAERSTGNPEDAQLICTGLADRISLLIVLADFDTTLNNERTN
jgi:hypothetical protein